MEIFEVIIRKDDVLEKVFYCTKSTQAVRRHYELIGYEVVLVKKVTKDYIDEITDLESKIFKANIVMSEAVIKLLETWIVNTVYPYF